MRLYFIRHGQSTNNAIRGDDSVDKPDPPLTEVGFKQAQLVAQHLATKPDPYPWDRAKELPTYGITHLIVSPMWRAMQTAKPISEALRLKPEIWDDIHEQGGVCLKDKEGRFVSYTGKKRSELMAEFPNFEIPPSISEEGWWNRDYETWDMCHIRAAKVTVRLRNRAEAEGEIIAVVAHQLFLGAMLHALFGMDVFAPVYFTSFNTGITRLDITENKTIFVRYLNRIDHLLPEFVTT